MIQKFFIIFIFSGMAFTALAQSPTPGPSSVPPETYLLVLNPSLGSQLVASADLGPSSQSTSSTTGCTLTSVQDGILLCFLADSCNRSTTFPLCGMEFSGPSGLTLTDVAGLISESSLGTRVSRRNYRDATPEPTSLEAAFQALNTQAGS